MNETARRRDKQLAFNRQHNITPTTMIKSVEDILEVRIPGSNKGATYATETHLKQIIDDY